MADLAGDLARIRRHPLAGGPAALRDPERPPQAHGIGEATQMVFASEDLFRAIRMLSRDEVVRWWQSETRPERRRLLEAALGVRGAMR